MSAKVPKGHSGDHKFWTAENKPFYRKLTKSVHKVTKINWNSERPKALPEDAYRSFESWSRRYIEKDKRFAITLPDAAKLRYKASLTIGRGVFNMVVVVGAVAEGCQSKTFSSSNINQE